MTLFVIWWIVCGALYAGIDYAFFQNEYLSCAKRDRIRDYVGAILIGVFGPFALFCVFFTPQITRHGWRFIPYPKDHPMYEGLYKKVKEKIENNH